MRTVIAVLPILLVTLPAFAQVILEAKPTVKVESNEAATSRFLLTEPERTQNRVTIIKRGDRYYWKTRENRELVHRVSGAFHFFIDPSGGGYIKVFDTHLLPEFVRDPGPRFHYMEHVTLWLGTITYWGTSEEFRLAAGDGS